MVLISDGEPRPEQTTSLCGTRIRTEEVEFLNSFAGMPCIACMTSPLAQGKHATITTRHDGFALGQGR